MKKLIAILSISFGICLAFVLDHSSSFAMGSAMTIDYAMWNAYNIGSEYLCGRAARNLQNPDYSDITQISGINNPFSSSDQYGQILWNASGRSGSISQVDVWNAINSSAQDFDVSSMSSEELNDFLDKVGVVQEQAGTNFVIKTSELNGIRFYWATNKAGEWLGTSFKNILAKFSTPSAETITNIQNECSSLYAYSGVCFSNSYFTRVDSTSFIDTYTYSFSGPVFIYCPSEDNPNKNLHFVVPFLNGQPLASGTAKQEHYKKLYDETVVYNWNITFNASTISNVFVGTYGSYDYYDIIQFPNSYPCENYFSSLSSITDYLIANGYLGETFDAELIDNQSVPYTVPEIGELATPITDVYPILEAIREGVISVPTTGELAKILYPALADEIADAISASKAESISIADTQDPTPPNPEPDNNFDPIIGWVEDLLPEEMFSMFEPIFCIVPANYSMYAFWITIPVVLLVCLIIYFIVSIF